MKQILFVLGLVVLLSGIFTSCKPDALDALREDEIVALDKYVKDNNITVIDEEIRDLGRKIAVSQFIQYGMKDVPEQYINEMADRILKNEKDKIRYKEVLLEDKVIDFIKETLKTEPKNITKEEFVKL